ncbi:putative redox protein [Chryseobacterium sp. IT-36CA2]
MPVRCIKLSIQYSKIMAVTVKASLGKTKYYTEVTAGENKIITDEPIDKGGQNKGLNPMEILATSLASCTAATLRMYIERKEWDVENINVEVELENFPLTKRAVFKRDISFDGILDDEQLKRLHTIADACPVHKILTNDIEILTKFS